VTSIEQLTRVFTTSGVNIALAVASLVSYMANFAGYANCIARIIVTFGMMLTDL
jgi:hypothetical protein